MDVPTIAKYGLFPNYISIVDVSLVTKNLLLVMVVLVVMDQSNIHLIIQTRKKSLDTTWRSKKLHLELKVHLDVFKCGFLFLGMRNLFGHLMKKHLN